LDDLLSFFYHKSLAPQSLGVGVHLDTRISTAFISFSVSCASVEKSVYHHCAKTPDCNIKKDIPEALFWYKLFAKSAKYENEKKYVKNIIQLTEAQLTEKEIKAVEIRVSKWTPTPRDVIY
jgi:hypothetical protein